MARGIAVVFAYAGHPVTIVDVKARDAADWAPVAEAAIGEVRATLATLAGFGLFRPAEVDALVRPAYLGRSRERRRLARLPMPSSSSRACPRCPTSSARSLARISALAGPQPIIASTTSTILVDDLAGAVGASASVFSMRIG